MIALDAVCKGYGGQVLLREVSWRIGRGERIGLCGPNGTGKTTLCRILAGVEEAVIQWLDGRPIPRADLVDLLRRAGLSMLDGVVPQAEGRS